MAFAETAKLAVRIDLEGNASAGIDNLNRKVTGLGGAVSRVGKGFGQVGLGIAKAGLVVGGAAVAGVTLATKAWIDYESAFAGVRKTLDASEAEFTAISTAYRKLATEIPVSAVELANIGEVAGQLGIKAKDLAAFTEQIAILGVAAPKLSTEEAAFGIARILTLTGQTTDKASNLTAAIVDLGNNFATTESHIIQTAERFASVGNAAGISTQGVLGLATAVTALGGEPQEAGTSLQRAIQNITLAVSGGELVVERFAKTAKMSSKDFIKLWKKDALTAFTRFLGGIKDLDNVTRTALLDELKLADARLGKTLVNLSTGFDITTGAIETANEAWADNTAHTIEAGKRFETLQSRLTTLRNNLQEAAFVLGEQVAPSIGRVAARLQKALQDPKFKEQLETLGKDIGKFIDKVDWDEVLDAGRTFGNVLMTAFEWAQKIYGVISKLPAEVQAAGVGLLAVNKLSGGLVGAGLGNIVGGLGQAVVRNAGSQLPGVGRAFAQPVFVTNWPVGGMGGAGGGVGGVAGGGKSGIFGGRGPGGLLGGLLTGALTLGAGLLVQRAFEIGDEQSAGTRDMANEIHKGLDQSIAGKTLPELKTALGGVQQGIADIHKLPFAAELHGDALGHLIAMETDLKTQISKSESQWRGNLAASNRLYEGVNDQSRRMDEQSIRTVDAIRRAEQATRDSAYEIRNGFAMIPAPVVSTTVNVHTGFTITGFQTQAAYKARYGSNATTRIGKHVGGAAPVW